MNKNQQARFTVKITQGIVKRAVPNDDQRCAIALACNEQLGCDNASVNDGISFGSFEFHKLPKRVHRFIKAFDRLDKLMDEVVGSEENFYWCDEHNTKLKKEAARIMAKAKENLAAARKTLEGFEIEFLVSACGDTKVRVK